MKLRPFAAAVALAIIFAVVVLCIVGVFLTDDRNKPPFGCTYVDVNPSKGADYRLACAEGYPK